MVSDIPSQLSRSVSVPGPSKASSPSLPPRWTTSSQAPIGPPHARPRFNHPTFRHVPAARIALDCEARVSHIHDLVYVPLRSTEGLVLYLKHAPSTWVFRLLPYRDPDQPRFWCLRVEACAGPSMSARTAPFDPFYTSLAMTREQLAQTLDDIRTDVAIWVEHPPQADLRAWLAGVIETPIPTEFAASQPIGRSPRPAAGAMSTTVNAAAASNRKHP